MSRAKWQIFCLDLNVLIQYQISNNVNRANDRGFSLTWQYFYIRVFGLTSLIAILCTYCKIRRRWVPQNCIDGANKSTLVQILAWWNQATSPSPKEWWPVLCRYMVSLGRHELACTPRCCMIPETHISHIITIIISELIIIDEHETPWKH